MPIKELRDIPAGEMIAITEGVYSNYSVVGFFRATKVIPVKALIQRWMVEHPDPRGAFDHGGFLAWVNSQGYLEQVNHWEWHLEDYSRADEMTVGEYMPYEFDT